MTELKPCPFCGYALPYEEGICGPGMVDEDEDINYPFCISCSGCGCAGPATDSEETAVAGWNTRHETN